MEKITDEPTDNVSIEQSSLYNYKIMTFSFFVVIKDFFDGINHKGNFYKV